MKHSLILALAAITLAGCEQQQPTEASAVHTPSLSSVRSNSGVNMTSSVIIPVSTSLFVQCATSNGQLPPGEQVGIRGSLQASSRLNTSASGTGTALIRIQPQGLSGLGFVSGTPYHATGSSQIQTSFASLPISSSAATAFNFVGKSGTAFQVTGTLNYSINAGGQLAATLVNPAVVCLK